MKGLFALPPGVDFAGEVVAGLVERYRDRPPQDLARVTILTNASRTMEALRAAFDRHGPRLLPGMSPITALRPANAPPPADPLGRQMQLSRLVEGLLARQEDLRSGQSVPAMSRSLAELMAEMQAEGLGFDALEKIETADHARHWQRMAQFLRIAAGFHLTDPPRDAEGILWAAAQERIAAWAISPPEDPVLVVGSTGSRGATHAVMEAVARLSNGAVILPGYDFDMPAGLWQTAMPADHPQSRHALLVDAFGPPQPWTGTRPAAPERNALVSLALRPAPVTDQWIADGPALGDLTPATQNLTLIEASQPAAEAEAIALLARASLEEGRPLVVITPDDLLKRRITAALDRWHVIPDDSQGVPLHLTAPGLLLRHVAGLMGRAITPDLLLILLKHPLAATGGKFRGPHLLLTRRLERSLRRRGPAYPDAEAIRVWRQGEKLGTTEDRDWVDWLAGWLEMAAPLARMRGNAPIKPTLQHLRELTEALAAGPSGTVEASELWREAPGRLACQVYEHLQSQAGLGPDMTPRDIASLIQERLAGQYVRAQVESNPMVRFYGAREARTEAVVADNARIVLAGMNEGSWPQLPPQDPWLSRQMRVEAGLTSPERRIGLSAHDFQQAIAAQEVVITRARRDADAETIPSRWVNRLINLMAGLPEQRGPELLAEMRARGATWLRWAEELAAPQATVASAPRPSPVPPPGSLSRLSVTQVSKLIRDPYALYADKILGLRALDPLRPAPDAAQRGQVLHRVVETFLTPPPVGMTAEELSERLMQCADQVLPEDVPWPAARAFWRARLARIADRFGRDEAARIAVSKPVVVEKGATARVADTGVELFAKPDRIDVRSDGQAWVWDYKSGTPPTEAQVRKFDKQLPLQAAMIRRGAFETLGPLPVAGAGYIQLGGEGASKEVDLPEDQIDADWAMFVALVTKYQTGEVGFTARRAPMEMQSISDYDHLSRYGEWSAADPATRMKVGDHDAG